MEIALLSLLLILFTLQYAPSYIKGPLMFMLLGVHSLFWFCPFFLVSLIKLISPRGRLKDLTTHWLSLLTEKWVATNMFLMKMSQKTQWIVDMRGDYQRFQNYFVLCNHQSWVDIFVLQKVLYKKIPFMKFFAKRELIWFPICGFVWWMLDFPFMYRFNKEDIKSDPTKKGIDIITTKKMCQRISHLPMSLMSFLEGTRFTTQKHQQQNSPFKHLLKPKAGGLANAVNILGDKLHKVINVTLVYPDGRPSFYTFFAGKINRVMVKIEEIEIPSEFFNKDYSVDREFRIKFQAWLNELWLEKDKTIEQLLQQSAFTHE